MPPGNFANITQTAMLEYLQQSILIGEITVFNSCRD